MANRDPEINIPSQQVRPGTITDALGNKVASGADVVVADCIAGVFPKSLRHDPYLQIGGGEMNLLQWYVAVKRSVGFTEGDAIIVPTGPNAGKYRAQQVEHIPKEPLVLALCIREIHTPN